MSDGIEGEFRELPQDGNVAPAGRRELRDPWRLTRDLPRWAASHRRALFIVVVILVVIAALAKLDMLGLTLGLLPSAWVAFLGISIAWGIVRWLARAESRREVREFLRQSWRVLILAGAVSLVIGEVARADDPTATTILALFLFFPVAAGVEAIVAKTRAGRWLNALRPRHVIAIALILVVLGPQFRREMPDEFCDSPNYWVETDYEENDYGGGSATYACFDPEAKEYVAPRVEGRSLFGLRLSNVALRMYSLNFTDSRFEGIGLCFEEEDCFP